MNTITPEKLGFSSKRLQRIDTLLQRYLDAGDIPGITLLIARRGELAYSKMLGMMDIETQRPIQPDTIFRIYSMTKPVTSVAVLMLHEEGHFFLDEPIGEFIPEFKHVRVYSEGGDLVTPERPITIRHLLTHTAGLTYGSTNSPVERMMRDADLHNRDTPLGDWVRRLAELPLIHHPGTVWHYSPAVDVLAYLVEVVSGMPFADYLRKHIFEPLAMVDTDFYVPANKIEHLATLYGAGLWVTSPESLGDYTKPPIWESGGGGLVATASDYLRFCQMLSNGGTLDDVRLLGRKTVHYMTSNQLLPHIDATRRQAGYGFGFGIDVLLNPVAAGRLSSVGEYGWSGGLASTHFWIDPLEEIIVVKMTQIVYWDKNHQGVKYRDLNTDLRTAVYQALID